MIPERKKKELPPNVFQGGSSLVRRMQGSMP